jgi:hypothetical protein
MIRCWADSAEHTVLVSHYSDTVAAGRNPTLRASWRDWQRSSDFVRECTYPNECRLCRAKWNPDATKSEFQARTCNPSESDVRNDSVGSRVYPLHRVGLGACNPNSIFSDEHPICCFTNLEWQ